MAASLKNFPLSDTEHSELRVFTATCTGSAEPLVHKPRCTVPNSPDPSLCKTLQTSKIYLHMTLECTKQVDVLLSKIPGSALLLI